MMNYPDLGYTKNVLDLFSQLNLEKIDTEKQIIRLTEAKKRLQHSRNTEINLEKRYGKAYQGSKDADRDTKRLAFDRLDLKIYTTRNKVDIKGYIFKD